MMKTIEATATLPLDVPPASKPGKTKAAAKVGAPRQALSVAPPQSPSNVLAIIARAASDKNVVPENMRALLDMQKEVMAEEARIAFVAAYIALQHDLPAIRPDGKIEIKAKDQNGDRTGRVQQATPYATFNNIMKVVKPILRQHGFALSYSTEPAADGQRILVKGFLDHERGHQRTTAFPLPAETSGSKNNVQGWGSSMSYGKRYATIALLNIISEAQEDSDHDGHAAPGPKAAAKESKPAPEPSPGISERQVDNLRDLIEDCGVGTQTFVEHFKIRSVADLPAERYAEAVQACANYKTRAAEKAAQRKPGAR